MDVSGVGVTDGIQILRATSTARVISNLVECLSRYAMAAWSAAKKENIPGLIFAKEAGNEEARLGILP